MHVDVVEAAGETGGLAKTHHLRNSRAFVDIGMHSLRAATARRLECLEDCVAVDFRQQCRLPNGLVDYPKGLLKRPRYLVSAIGAQAKRAVRARPEDNSYDYLCQNYGRAVVDEVLEPIVTKWLGKSLRSLSRQWALQRLRAPRIGAMVRQLRLPRGNIYHYAEAYQPRRGIVDALQPLIRDVSGAVHLRSPVTRIDTEGGRIVRVVAGEHVLRPDVVVSTIPLDALGRLLAAVPEMASLASLRYRHLRFVMCRVAMGHFRPSMLAYVPETDYSFYRIGIPKTYWPEHCEADEFVVCAELGHDGEPVNEPAEDVVVEQLCRFYGIPVAAVRGVDTAWQPNAYPIMAAADERIFQGLQHETAVPNLFLSGRTGLFRYWLIAECLQAADECADRVLEWRRASV